MTYYGCTLVHRCALWRAESHRSLIAWIECRCYNLELATGCFCAGPLMLVHGTQPCSPAECNTLQMVHSPLGEALATFAGEPGGPQVPAWQLRPPLPPKSEQAPRVLAQPPPLPQPLSAGASLAITQLQLLGRVFAVLDEHQQSHILECIVAALAAEAPPGVR